MSNTAQYDYDSEQPFLTAEEARVIGSLMEKQMTTPDYYPLTLNALIAACNQKSSREPVMNLGQGEVAEVIRALRARGLVTANTLSRADRFEQQLTRKFGLQSRQRAVLCVLLLRGPQTLNEIRIRTERMCDFPDNDAVHDTLQQLMDAEAPLAVQLPRAAGQREERFMHLLCGKPEISAAAAPAPKAPAAGESDERIDRLEREVAELREEIALLWQASGLQKPASD